jgi:hypothetical protein
LRARREVGEGWVALEAIGLRSADHRVGPQLVGSARTLMSTSARQYGVVAEAAAYRQVVDVAPMPTDRSGHPDVTGRAAPLARQFPMALDRVRTWTIRAARMAGSTASQRASASGPTRTAWFRRADLISVKLTYTSCLNCFNERNPDLIEPGVAVEERGAVKKTACSDTHLWCPSGAPLLGIGVSRGYRRPVTARDTPVQVA